MNPATDVESETRWQPIDTAPKDGTSILTYAPSDRPDDETYAVVYWLVYKREEFQSIDGTETYKRVIKEDYAWWEGGPWTPWRATHWMPLPEPPK